MTSPVSLFVIFPERYFQIKQFKVPTIRLDLLLLDSVLEDKMKDL